MSSVFSGESANETLMAFLPIIVPLLIILVPGLAWLRRPVKREEWPAMAARVVLTSITVTILLSLLAVVAGLPPVVALWVSLLAVLLVGIRSKNRRLFLRQTLMFTTPVVVVYGLFAAPFLYWHDGLPTGDTQKAIIWSQEILSKHRLPEYRLSASKLNRDPVDFYTPGLHTLTAAVWQAIPQNQNNIILPLMAVGFAAIAGSIAIAIVAAAIAYEVSGGGFVARLAAGIAPLLLLTNFRFLRYLREPGYHWQNIIGELCLFGAVFLALRLLKHWHKWDLVLLVMALLALGMTHQFSAFVAAFVMLPLIVAVVYQQEGRFISLIKQKAWLVLIAIIFMGCAMWGAVALNLWEKIPHLFTSQPHLLEQTPTINEYGELLGYWWILTALGGALALMRRKFNLTAVMFFIGVINIVILSQGPRLGIDIPPVRALFYLAVPSSVLGAVFLSSVVLKIWKNGSPLKIALVLLAGVAATAPMVNSLKNAWQISHDTRTNSTLLGGYLPLIEELSAPCGNAACGVLTDDYNRRSSSWLVLSGKPVYARLAADLERPMMEAKQSVTRREVYLKQLDLEKIYSLGSYPLVSSLLTKHGIGYVTGSKGSSDTAFSHNPSLRPAMSGEKINIYYNWVMAGEVNKAEENWLLRPTTLVNDIGDDEDTFKHLPVSLRTTRLSEPRWSATKGTTRTTTAPVIPLSINVGDYVQVLWDQDNNDIPDGSLSLVVKLVNGSPQMELVVNNGQKVSIMTDGTINNLPPGIKIGEDGFVNVALLNPGQKEIEIDLLAAGLARVP